MSKLFAIRVLALTAVIGIGCSKPAPTQHARVELVAQQSAVVPGTDLQLGVHFVLDPGWHIYWINPGDSGQPPSFNWHLPAGFTTGPMQWPRPERMQPIKELADYGYHDEILLPIVLHVPTSLPDSPAKIHADAKWLICREVCIPEHSQLQLSLPRAATPTANPQSAELFSSAQGLLPQPLPSAWTASASSSKDQFVLTVRAGRAITSAQFFPLDPGQIDNPAPQAFQSMNTGGRLTLKKSDLLTKPISVLRGVLVIPGSPAYQIEAGVQQSIQ